MRVAWLAINIFIGGVVILLLVVRGKGKILELLVVLLVHFSELSG